MSKFRKSDNKETPAISTASLPDIVFMLLFFIMVSTTMRETTMKVRVSLPEATEISKLEKKSLVSYIYVGPPQQQFVSQMGSEPRIQLNDDFKDVKDIIDYVESERQSLEEQEQKQMIVSLKVDEYTKMGIVTDIKQELRKAAALHINYSTKKGK
ncbi:MAG: biopolymer transporter ExbD [Prolixibacteraceae bacterium]|nr:biopolymer transporter ExbD [Prolixibacteraceae bacterium]MBN2648747.1 biopolymer transporter ExbD [Prolixibacteraceae bacterium]